VTRPIEQIRGFGLGATCFSASDRAAFAKVGTWVSIYEWLSSAFSKTNDLVFRNARERDGRANSLS
jgi:hypothetical protein